MNPHKHRSVEEGFTLVELSIVLVIIGLIIGGVLVGQDMIKAAEIRSTVSQIQEYDTAANTFRDKYEYVPGDVAGAKATILGLTARSGAIGRGDGNGLIQAAAASGAASIYLGYETALYWRDLNQMSLVAGSFDTASDALITSATPDTNKLYMPEAKIKRGNLITVFASTGRNYYQITGVTAVAAGVYTLTAVLSPQEAMNLDQKLDDGRPLTGVVRAAYSTSTVDGIQAKNNATASAYVASSFTACVASDAASGTATDPYQVSTEDYSATPACQLRIRAAF